MRREHKCPTHKVALVPQQTQWGRRWQCPAEGCTVACWGGRSSTPADDRTRDLRKQCHAAFDPLWQRGALFARPNGGGKTNRRNAAYAWLAERLGLPVARTHFGYFNAGQCERALTEIKALTAHGGREARSAIAATSRREQIRDAVNLVDALDDDLPDGAYFAMIEDISGFDAADVADALAEDEE